MRIALVYHSAGGNTKALAEAIASRISGVDVFRMSEFDVRDLMDYDGLIVGAYTWGDGDLPAKAVVFYEALYDTDLSHLTTAIFGTGETNYRVFCGAVDIFADLLNDRSNLAVTLKVEQMYQPSDIDRIDKFCKIFLNKLHLNNMDKRP